MMALESSALSALFVETLLGQGKGPKMQKVFKESKKMGKKRDVFSGHGVKKMFFRNFLSLERFCVFDREFTRR